MGQHALKALSLLLHALGGSVISLLSDEELAAFLDLQRRSVRCSLYELHQLDCLEPIATEVGKRWHLCGRGLRLIAAANRIHIRNIAALPDDGVASETPTVVQRGEA
jgi:hypothetical protein